MDIADWLCGLGLSGYEAVFRDNAIDGDTLPELTEPDLEKLGVLLGHRKRVLRAVARRFVSAVLDGEALNIAELRDGRTRALPGYASGGHPDTQQPDYLIYVLSAALRAPPALDARRRLAETPPQG